jgi:hypothetical protein
MLGIIKVYYGMVYHMNFIISNLLNSQGGTVSVLKMYVDSRTETTVWYQFIPDPINVKFLVLYGRATLTKKLFSSGKDFFRSLFRILAICTKNKILTCLTFVWGVMMPLFIFPDLQPWRRHSVRFI